MAFNKFKIPTSEEKKSMHFWKRFIRLVGIAHPSPRFLSVKGSLWLPFFLAGLIGLRVLVVQQYGLVRGNFAKAIGDLSVSDLKHALWHGFIFSTLNPAMSATMFFLQELIKNFARYNLVRTLQNQYMDGTTSYKINRIDKRHIFADQRLTMDTNNFADAWAEVVSKTIDTPIQIVYFNIVSVIEIGWFGPLVIFGYYFILIFFAQFMIRPLIQRIFLQQTLEARLRKAHIKTITAADQIALIHSQLSFGSVNKEIISDNRNINNQNINNQKNRKRNGNNNIESGQNNHQFNQQFPFNQHPTYVAENKILWKLYLKVFYNSIVVALLNFIMHMFRLVGSFDSYVVSYGMLAWYAFFTSLFDDSRKTPGLLAQKISNCLFLLQTLADNYANILKMFNRYSELSSYTNRVGEFREICLEMKNLHNTRVQTKIKIISESEYLNQLKSIHKRKDNEDQNNDDILDNTDKQQEIKQKEKSDNKKDYQQSISLSQHEQQDEQQDDIILLRNEIHSINGDDNIQNLFNDNKINIKQKQTQSEQKMPLLINHQNLSFHQQYQLLNQQQEESTKYIPLFLNIHNFNVYIPGRTTPVIKDLNITFPSSFLIKQNIQSNKQDKQQDNNLFSTSIYNNTHLLITGDNGIGKSTLLRSFCGIWAESDGIREMIIMKKENEQNMIENDNEIDEDQYNGSKCCFNSKHKNKQKDQIDYLNRDNNQQLLQQSGIYFIPQVPHLPHISLQQLIEYPLIDEEQKIEQNQEINQDQTIIHSNSSSISSQQQSSFSYQSSSSTSLQQNQINDQIQFQQQSQSNNGSYLFKLLSQVHLQHLISRQTPRDYSWEEVLSPGEMQLLSFARIIKNASNISFLFLDEATSALTAEHESEMYQILNELGISYHTVGHGGLQLQSFHNKQLELKGGISGQWELTDL